MSDTVPVEYRVIGTEPVHGRGRLERLAVVEVEIAGIVIVLQGVQVMRNATGGLECRAPALRHPRTGRWLPAVLLPVELSDAIAAEVLA
jgi:hypothetical protein